MVIVGTHTTAAEDMRGELRCPGLSADEVAAALWDVERFATNEVALLKAKLCYGISLASGVYYPNPEHLALPRTKGEIASKSGPDK